MLMTGGMSHLVADNEVFAANVCLSLKRHVAGDWGDICDEDRVANELALQHGDRLMVDTGAGHSFSHPVFPLWNAAVLLISF